MFDMVEEEVYTILVVNIDIYVCVQGLMCSIASGSAYSLKVSMLG